MTDIALYQPLIAQMNAMPNDDKQTLMNIYTGFSTGQTVPLVSYDPDVVERLQLTPTDNIISACFGCSLPHAGCHECGQGVQALPHTIEHQVCWNATDTPDAPAHSVIAWCIWDAFFIALCVGRPAHIITHDPIHHAVIRFDFDGATFVAVSHNAQDLRFTFPMADANGSAEQLQGQALRSCFCCRTKAFLNEPDAQGFADTHHCEVIDMPELIRRSHEMRDALTPTPFTLKY